jgi:hypothetical protein
MLADDGRRQEIDLAAPASPPQPIPDPVCAQGVVQTELADETEPAPGTSPLDEGLQKLTTELAPPPMDPVPPSVLSIPLPLPTVATPGPQTGGAS